VPAPDHEASAPLVRRPFLPGDFEEGCEECQAPAGAYCRPWCGSGYTAEDAQAEAARLAAGPGRTA